jgi:putative membrane protein
MAQRAYVTRSEAGKTPLSVRIGISWLTNALVLGVVAAVLSNVRASSAVPLLGAAAVFGVLNTMLKPFLRIVTFPVMIFTLGIAWFFVSMLMLAITRDLVAGFFITGFSTLVYATIIVWIVNLALDRIPGPWQIAGRRGRRNRRRIVR